MECSSPYCRCCDMLFVLIHIRATDNYCLSAKRAIQRVFILKVDKYTKLDVNSVNRERKYWFWAIHAMMIQFNAIAMMAAVLYELSLSVTILDQKMQKTVDNLMSFVPDSGPGGDPWWHFPGWVIVKCMYRPKYILIFLSNIPRSSPIPQACWWNRDQALGNIIHVFRTRGLIY